MNAEDCFESILTRSWYSTYAALSYAGLAGRFEWLSLILSDKNRVRVAVLHGEYRHYLSQIVDDEAARKALQQQYYMLQCSVTPIYYLPVEVLTKILHIALDTGELQTELMSVCRYWHKTIEGMSNIWTSLKLQACTAPERVRQSLNRAGTLPLTVEIDINKAGDMTEGVYSALAIAANNSSQWETLTITSLPQSEQGVQDVDDLLSIHLQSMDQIKHLKVMSSVSSPIPQPLLQKVATATVGSLASIEIYSSSAILNLLQPVHASVFGSLTTFKAQVPNMSRPVDLLPHFNQLEVLELTNLPLPIHDYSSLPLVRTLHQLRLKAVSIQWMGGKVFSRLESCAIITPPTQIHPLILDVSLPACTRFQISYKDISLFRKFQVPNVCALLVKSNQWSIVRGDEQVSHLFGVALATPLQPRVLHLAIPCQEKALIALLQLLPCLEELRLDLLRPSALGKRFFKALLAEPGGQVDWVQFYNLKKGKAWISTMCPCLRVLELNYQKWVRQSDNLDFLVPLFALVWSRERTSTPLRVDLHLKSSQGSWKSFDLTPQSTIAISRFDIPSLMHSDQALSVDLFEHCFTSVNHHSLEISSWEGNIYETRLFTHCFYHLQVLRIYGPGQMLNVLPCFHHLKELSLDDIHVPPFAHDIDLPLVHTLRTLSLEGSSLAWMDGRVFAQLERFEVDEYGWPESFKLKVWMPACTHIVFRQEKLSVLPLLQSYFRLPLLDMWELRYFWEDSKYDERGITALQCIQTKAFHCPIGSNHQGLVELLESKDEVAHLELKLYYPSDPQGILTRLSVINRNTEKMPCSYMKDLGLQFWSVTEDDREKFSQWCIQMMNSRRSAGHPIEKCSIWWAWVDWRKAPSLVLVL